MIVNERCNRVHLLNLLEEPGLCLRCDYCFFIRKLKNALQEMLFFTTNAHIQKWHVKYKDQILTLNLVHLSLDNKQNGTI